MKNKDLIISSNKFKNIQLLVVNNKPINLQIDETEFTDVTNNEYMYELYKVLQKGVELDLFDDLVIEEAQKEVTPIIYV